MRIVSGLTETKDSSKEIDLQKRYDKLLKQYKTLTVNYEKLLTEVEGLEAFNSWRSKSGPDGICVIGQGGEVVFQDMRFIDLIEKSREGTGNWRISDGKKTSSLKHQIIRTARKLLESPDIFPLKVDYFPDTPTNDGIDAAEALLEPYTYGEKSYVAITLRDVTARTSEDKNLHNLSLYFRSIVDPLAEDVFIIDKDYRINYVSNSFLEKAGMLKKDILGRYCYDIANLKAKCYKDDRQCLVRRAYAKGEPVRLVRQSIGHNGSVRCTDVIAVPIRDGEGNIIQVLETSRDVSEFMAAHNALLTSERRYQTLIEQLPVIVYTASPDETNFITFISPQIKSLTGISASEIVSSPSLRLEIIQPADRPRVIKEFFNSRKSGRTFECEYRVVKPGGELAWVHDRAVLVSDEKGEPQYFLGVMTDISDRKKADERIRMLSYRLLNVQEEEKSRIACDLHDGLGQSLAAINYSLENISRLLPKTMQSEREKIKELNGLLRRSATDVKRIAFNLRPSMLDPLGLIPTLEWVSKHISETYNLQVDFQAMGIKKKLLPHVEINLFRFFQEAINNVVKHAQAQNVRMKLIHRYPKIIAIISDDGRGFDVNSTVLHHDMNGHMGIVGMKQRVSTLGGQFHIKSAVGEGTAIRIEIPSSQEEGL